MSLVVWLRDLSVLGRSFETGAKQFFFFSSSCSFASWGAVHPEGGSEMTELLPDANRWCLCGTRC